MFKKIIVVVLALLFFASFTLAAKKKPVKKEEVKEPVRKVETVDDEAFKQKIAIGYDVINQAASLRFWPNRNMGLEFTGGLGFTTGNASSFKFNAGMNMIFPMFRAGSFYLNLDPGIKLGFNNQGTSTNVQGGTDTTSSNNFQVLLGCWLECELFLTSSQNFSIGSSVGAGFTINPSSYSITNTNYPLPGTNTTTTSNTSVGFSAATDFGVIPLVIRYYF